MSLKSFRIAPKEIKTGEQVYATVLGIKRDQKTSTNKSYDLYLTTAGDLWSWDIVIGDPRILQRPERDLLVNEKICLEKKSTSESRLFVKLVEENLK